KDNRNSIRKEVLHLIKFVKKTVAIPKSTLYSIPEVREQIAFYRKGWFYKQKQDDTKSDCMIHSLVRKIKSLEPKNKGKELKLQIKKIYGNLFEGTTQE
ncbi:hypothetical protein QJS76_02105, partial [Enterococcus faecium]|uniref:hypothetical protein n=1 Tax=Enterococcus faecium TaxID=1352 RepID=UPI00396CC675